MNKTGKRSVYSLYASSMKRGGCCLLLFPIFLCSQQQRNTEGAENNASQETISNQGVFYVAPGTVLTNKENVYVVGSSSKKEKHKLAAASKIHPQKRKITKKVSPKETSEYQVNHKRQIRVEYKTPASEHTAGSFSDITSVGIGVGQSGGTKKKIISPVILFLGVFLCVLLLVHTLKIKAGYRKYGLRSGIFKKENIRPPPVCL